ncbi:Plastid division protein PDV [Trema orientale]|uniref:Plastid division protein PDV n=1 Tax=Trema orientale TaxID=63057 RepID=A0A2P5FGJ7_TREOI|nr:Plastid division protein PDV [Trema orientale]
MEIDEIEAVLEKIWDLHDKLSDAIHSISRAHFLNSIKPHRKSDNKKKPPSPSGNDAVSDETRGGGGGGGFVFVKGFRLDLDDDSAIQEAKSLNSIRTALENLEDHLEILHTVQVQQRAERDAAIAQLEQSRIVLAMRLAEHHGKKYKVIEEALAFVGDVQEAKNFISHERLYGPPFSSSGENLAATREGKRPNILYNVLVSSFNFAKKSLNLESLGGVLGNAALVAISMIALLQLQQVAHKDRQKHEDVVFVNRRVRKATQLQESSSDDRSSNLDVLLARG